MDESRWLVHKHLFMKSTVEEGIVDIKLSERPVVREGYREDCTNGDWFRDWTKGVKIVLAILLKEPFGYESGFVFSNGSIWMSFNAKDPFTTYWGMR